MAISGTISVFALPVTVIVGTLSFNAVFGARRQGGKSECGEQDKARDEAA